MPDGWPSNFPYLLNASKRNLLLQDKIILFLIKKGFWYIGGVSSICGGEVVCLDSNMKMDVVIVINNTSKQATVIQQ